MLVLMLSPFLAKSYHFFFSSYRIYIFYNPCLGSKQTCSKGWQKWLHSSHSSGVPRSTVISCTDRSWCNPLYETQKATWERWLFVWICDHNHQWHTTDLLGVVPVRKAFITFGIWISELFEVQKLLSTCLHAPYARALNEYLFYILPFRYWKTTEIVIVSTSLLLLPL